MDGQKYARSVSLDLDLGSWDQILTFAEAVKEQVSGFAGLVRWEFVANRSTGKGTSFSVFESEAAFLAVSDEVSRVLASLKPFLSGPPVETVGHVWLSVERGAGSELPDAGDHRLQSLGSD